MTLTLTPTPTLTLTLTLTLTGEETVSLQVDAVNMAAVSLYGSLGYETLGQDSALTTPSGNPLVSSYVENRADMTGLRGPSS